MKEEIAKKWVKALRSGDYKQETSALNPYGDTQCCLGVLCEISEISSFDEGGIYGEGCGITLPETVLNWAGMRKDNFGGRFGRSDIVLWELNDMKRNDFNYIADVIEKNWEQL